MDYRYRDKSELKQVESDWFSLVPNNWNVLMFKRIIESVKNGIWGDEPKQNEDDIPCIRILNFNRNEMEVNIDDLTTRNIPILKQRDYILKKGDLLIEKSGGGEKNPVGFVVRYNHDLPAVYANFMAKISLNENEAKSDYIKYLCSNIYNKRIHLDSVNQTTGIQNLDTETYFKRVIPLPNINEQEKIAKFLDEKTAKFDSIISKKEALIEKLKEAKKSLISEVVTGKVKVVKTNDGYELVERKREEMKDSGVEWLADIPTGWSVSKIKYICSINSNVLSENTDEDYEIKYIDIGSVNSNGSIINLQEYKFKDAPSRARRIVNDKDILISTVRTYLKAITSIEKSEENLICSTGFAVLSPSENIDYKFLSYFVRGNKFIDEIVSRSVGVSYPAITSSEIANLEVIIPSFDEQIKIGNYIDNNISKLNGIISNTEKQIKKIKEAKQSLISEAVTGKIEIL